MEKSLGNHTVADILEDVHARGNIIMNRPYTFHQRRHDGGWKNRYL